MIEAYSVATVRAAEERAMARLPEGALMQRAAAGLATALLRALQDGTGGVYGRHVVLLVGPGDNGGDALWAGARLLRRGAQVTAVRTSGTVHAEGRRALLAAGGQVVDATVSSEAALEVLGRAALVVDGLLGIGARPGLEGPAAELAQWVDTDGPGLVAVDLPSGVDPDSGGVPGRFGPYAWCESTVTFGVLKPCLLLPPAAHAAGRVDLVDIGLDLAEAAPVVRRLEPVDVLVRWPAAGESSDKYSRGVVGVVAGGATYTGAAVLSTGAAVRSGAGMVRYLGPGAATDLVRARWPEVVPGPGRVQAWVLGPGLDPDDEGQAEHVRTALAGEEPCLVDAGALALLPELLRSGDVAAPLLLTPHAGELARLLTDLGTGTDRDAVEADPLAHARTSRAGDGRDRPAQGRGDARGSCGGGGVLPGGGSALAGHRRRRRRPGRDGGRAPRRRRRPGRRRRHGRLRPRAGGCDRLGWRAGERRRGARRRPRGDPRRPHRPVRRPTGPVGRVTRRSFRADITRADTARARYSDGVTPTVERKSRLKCAWSNQPRSAAREARSSTSPASIAAAASCSR